MEKEIEEMRKNERIREEKEEHEDDDTEEHEKLKYKGGFSGMSPRHLSMCQLSCVSDVILVTDH